MAKRRAIAAMGAMVASALLVISGPAVAQEEDSPPTVAPAVIEAREQPSARVEGAVQTQPLPRTGGDFGVEVLAGLALTAAGLALAASARVRRTRATAAA